MIFYFIETFMYYLRHSMITPLEQVKKEGKYSQIQNTKKKKSPKEGTNKNSKRQLHGGLKSSKPKKVIYSKT